MNQYSTHPDTTAIELRFDTELTLSYKEPFNFRYTFWKPSHFHTDLEYHSECHSWRTFNVAGILCGVRFEHRKQHIDARVFSNAPLQNDLLNKLQARLIHSYGLEEDLGAFNKLAQRVRGIDEPLQRLFGMRMSCPENVFEIAIISLLLQNTTVARSTQMMRSILQRYGSSVCFDGVLLNCFFSAERILGIPEIELREHCRLGYRAKYFPAFAKYFYDHDPDLLLALPYDQAMKKLQSIKGVGPYTSGIICSHALRRTDAVGLDSWNRKIAAKALLGVEDASSTEVLSRLHELFPGYEGTALMYFVENEFIDQPVVPLTS
jgi:3-methyladenine DNA glycosylase/8-oxoguanine DNA glycosylase